MTEPAADLAATSFSGALGEDAGDRPLLVRVITPHSGLEGLKSAAISLRRDFRQARHLAWRFFLRDVRAEHRQSLLGYAWLVFPALANTLVWVFLNDQKLVNIDSGQVPYPLFVLTGTILWTAFTATLTALLGVVSTARSVLAKVNFPQEALVYAAFLRASVDSGITSILLVPAFILFSAPAQPEMLLFPLAILGSLLLGAAIALLILPIAVLYSDIGRGIHLLLRFGFFLTPIIFMLPASGIARRVMLLNPATPIVATGRGWLTNSGEAMPGAFIVVITSCLILAGIGLLIYKVALPHLIERIGE